MKSALFCKYCYYRNYFYSKAKEWFLQDNFCNKFFESYAFKVGDKYFLFSDKKYVVQFSKWNDISSFEKVLSFQEFLEFYASTKK